MNKARQKRLYGVFAIVLGVTAAVGFALYALGQNINLFYSPTQIFADQVPHNRLFRVGGIVELGSVKHVGKSLDVRFKLTDTLHDVVVNYHGILPDLFREGQGIVAEGRLNNRGVFVANQVLAKHDSTYMPPEVKAAIAKAKAIQQQLDKHKKS